MMEDKNIETDETAGTEGEEEDEAFFSGSQAEADGEEVYDKQDEWTFEGEGEESPEIKPDDTITFKRSHLYALLIPLTFVVGLSVGYIFWGREDRTPQTVSVPQAVVAESESRSSSNPQPDPGAQSENQTGSQAQSSSSSAETSNIVRYDVPLDDDPTLGPEDAAITIIEFSDYECPFCQKWHQEVFDRLLASYPDQIRFVYRDFPLTSIHSNAVSAAEAANCAGDQGEYWEYHNALFGSEYGLGMDAYLQYATDIGLDVDAFTECVDSGRHAEEVQNDFEYAARLGVRSTPTFFINGIAIVGAQPFEVFQQVIDKEIAGEIP